ncbi:MAG: tetratricopeptide repeat protein [Proteobacteria bacterium]|nr:tetratricopeptide repeat protein [Pseudomonadota bacterium]
MTTSHARSLTLRRIGFGAVIALLSVQVVGVAWLSRHVPYEHLSGGPDEPMHLSVANSIARHLTWPSWDSPELVRYRNGGSYATGPAFGYWIEGLLARGFGTNRLSGVLLFAGIAAVAGGLAWRRPLAGLVCAAVVTPQVMFIFAYVNADAWAVFVAFHLGLAIALVGSNPSDPRRLAYFLCSAAACLTSKPHLWALGFAAFSGTLAAYHGGFLAAAKRRQSWLILAGAVAIAAWWPLTSYFAHGDFLGAAARQNALDTFGAGAGASLAKPWQELELGHFTTQVAKSMYGYWGWAWLPLPGAYYAAAALLTPVWFAAGALSGKRWLAFFVGLPLLNFALLLVYSVNYDYQWQGRYLLPSLLLVCGVAAGRLAYHPRSQDGRWPAAIAAGLVLFSGLHLVSATTLWKQLEVADRMPSWQRGEILFRTGDLGWARHHFEQALAKGEQPVPVHSRLAEIALREDDPATAVEHYRHALRLLPGHPDLVLALATALERAGDQNGAVDELRELLRQQPGHPRAAARLEQLERREAP